jgi:integrating conjugative element protein (TIGR03765 family)
MMDFILDKVVSWLTAILLNLPLCLLFYGLPGKPVQAAPVVIHDNGNALPIRTLLPELTPELPKDLPATQPPGDPGAAFMAGLFPVRSPNLSPGTVEAREVSLNVTQPFFLVGNDDGSLTWLANYCPRLKEIQASGLVVEALSLEQFKAITETCPGLPMAPVNGDGLAKELGISHYPVLVSGRRIEQ